MEKYQNDLQYWSFFLIYWEKRAENELRLTSQIYAGRHQMVKIAIWGCHKMPFGRYQMVIIHLLVVILLLSMVPDTNCHCPYAIFIWSLVIELADKGNDLFKKISNGCHFVTICMYGH